MTFEDQEILKDRLAFTWKEPEVNPAASSTRSRQSRARSIYRRIQDASNNLFLATVLVVPPTSCIKPGFQPILNQLIYLDNYDIFWFQLGPKEQKFFESTAAEQGFAGNKLYLDFMGSLFPKLEFRREHTLNS